MNTRRASLLALLFVLGMAVNVCAQALTEQVVRVAPAEAPSLKGRVILIGAPPPETEIKMDAASLEIVRSPKKTRHYVVGKEGGLANVVVKVVGLKDQNWPAPVQPLVIANRQCLFEPYVSAMQLGQKVRMVNEDPLMHNVHLVARQTERNYAQMPNGKPLEFELKEAEDFVRLKCDEHPWMFAYVTVVEHPYFAVTDAEGKFEIKGLPEGNYEFVAMHRKAGMLTTRVNGGRTSSEALFEFKVPPQN